MWIRSERKPRPTRSSRVLAETATPAEDFDPAMIAEAIKDAEEDITDAKSDVARDKARQRLEQMQSLRAVLEQ